MRLSVGWRLEKVRGSRLPSLYDWSIPFGVLLLLLVPYRSSVCLKSSQNFSRLPWRSPLDFIKLQTLHRMPLHTYLHACGYIYVLCTSLREEHRMRAPPLLQGRGRPRMMPVLLYGTSDKCLEVFLLLGRREGKGLEVEEDSHSPDSLHLVMCL